MTQMYSSTLESPLKQKLRVNFSPKEEYASWHYQPPKGFICLIKGIVEHRPIVTIQRLKMAFLHAIMKPYHLRLYISA